MVENAQRHVVRYKNPRADRFRIVKQRPLSTVRVFAFHSTTQIDANTIVPSWYQMKTEHLC